MRNTSICMFKRDQMKRHDKNLNLTTFNANLSSLILVFNLNYDTLHRSTLSLPIDTNNNNDNNKHNEFSIPFKL